MQRSTIIAAYGLLHYVIHIIIIHILPSLLIHEWSPLLGVRSVECNPVDWARVAYLRNRCSCVCLHRRAHLVDRLAHCKCGGPTCLPSASPRIWLSVHLILSVLH